MKWRDLHTFFASSASGSFSDRVHAWTGTLTFESSTLFRWMSGQVDMHSSACEAPCQSTSIVRADDVLTKMDTSASDA